MPIESQRRRFWESRDPETRLLVFLIRTCTIPTLHMRAWAIHYSAGIILMGDSISNELLTLDHTREREAMRWQQSRFCVVPHEVVAHIMRTPHIISALSEDTPKILVAATFEDASPCKSIMDSGFQLWIDHDGFSAAHSTASKLFPEVCRLLAMRGFDSGIKDDTDVTPLMEAVYLGNEEAVRIILEAGASANTIFKTPSSIRISEDEHLPRYESKPKGAWYDRKIAAFESFKRLKWSILHMAVWRESLAIVDRLLDHVVHTSKQDAESLTPLL